MKEIVLGISVFLSALISAQNYPANVNNTNAPYYGTAENAAYFPDDYYYEYPGDYYTEDFYQSSYNDYRNSIYDVNWNQFFARTRLAPWQIQQIMILNDRYASYNAWNSYYRYNPDRWYYDRFYALQNIMGPNIFIIFQNNYYRGYNPVVYYQNYRRQHYVTNIYVVPRYRNININRYRIDRAQYQLNNPRQEMGFTDRERNNSGNWQNNNSANGGFRNNNVRSVPANDGFRNSPDTGLKSLPLRNNDSFRGNSDVRPQSSAPRTNDGFRNNNSGLKNKSTERKSEMNTERKNPAPGLRTSAGSAIRFSGR